MGYEQQSRSPFTELRFQQPFRKYQQMVLDLVGQRTTADSQFHIVAPPGAGKTIVGLEVIRQFGCPAVVFAPTTTIQQQWQEKVALFAPHTNWITRHTSTDAAQLADITILTYQILSTPGENLEFVERVAVEKWVDDLLKSGQAATEPDAHQRIATLRQTNPQAARNEISKRYQRIKRDFLKQKEFDGRQFLHPNARDLIDRIVKLGVGVVVLDECHHLLDYWAFILRELIKSLPNVRVIGLTATLPEPENESEYENYHSLLGEVDFEVPTPAVVKEGNLAPYRDLVYFCEPSTREKDYLQQIQTHFETAVSRIASHPSFQNWITTILTQRTDPFETFFNREPLLCIAAVKYTLGQERPLPDDVVVVEEMLEPMAVDDWLTLLEVFGLRILKVSADKTEQELYRELRDMLLNFGITISERGISHQRSPGDLILALSESKDLATVRILQVEADHLKDKLRAVVITDFEKMSASTRRLKEVLDPDAGSAVRVFRQLVANPDTNRLDPVLVTGKVVLANAANRERLDKGIHHWRQEKKADFVWEWQPTENEKILQLMGNGRDWGSRTYVALITSLFEQGVTQCLVGTRGIFGEGWDALSLNTLVDLTAVTTSTSVQQIRGRTIRLHPGWPRKVAHNWDVVCYNTKFDKGNADLRRFVARHDHTWGIVVRSRWQDLKENADGILNGLMPGTPWQGRIIRGVGHVDLDLAAELGSKPFKHINFRRYTNRMMAAISQRDTVYDLWRIGEPYSNFRYSASQIQAEDIKFQTVYRIEESLWMMAWRLLASIVGVMTIVWLLSSRVLLDMPGNFLGIGAVIGVVLGIITAVLLNLRGMWRVYQQAFLQLPADDILFDIGRSLVVSLSQSGVISRSLNESYVRIVETEAGGYEVFLDYASPEDANVFAQAFQELLGPIGDARYLLERDSSSLRNPLFRMVWVLVRTTLLRDPDPKVYHRVPEVLASRKERAEALAAAWGRFVGGGRLVFTRTTEGRRILLEARGQQRRQIKQMAFEVWR